MTTPNFAFVGLLLTLSVGAHAQTVTRPPPPVLSVAGNLKELIFDWEPVAGVGTYRLMTNTGPRGYFEPLGDRLGSRRTRVAIPIAAHQHNWTTQRFLVLACNSAGCTRSNEVTPATGDMLATIGYVKASNTGAQDRFGTQVALSADGSTLAVSAGGEDGANNTLPNSGAVYIYRRNGRQWAQEAMLKASDGLAGTQLGGGSPLAFRYMGLSATGSTLAVGAPTRERFGHANAGVVFVYQRAADNSWHEQAQLTASPVTANDHFGYSVDVSSDGLFIKVSSMHPQGGAGTPEGRTHIWNWHLTGNYWSYAGAIAPFYAGDRCPTTRMTADAKLLVMACRTPSGEGRLVTLRRFADQIWSRVADEPYLWFENPNMAVNYDGAWLVMHKGSQFAPFESIGIFRREQLDWIQDGSWTNDNNERMGFNGLGHALDISRNGEYIAFSDPTWRASGAGSVEEWGPSSESHGAVMIFKRRPQAIPQHWYTRIVKATNPGDTDRFGESVSFGGADGFYLAIGAPQEDGAARGVDGNQTSEAAEDAGAVYLY